jgi:hypothetical protein
LKVVPAIFVALSKFETQRPILVRIPTRTICGAVIALCMLSFGRAFAYSAETAAVATVDPTALVRRAVQHRLDSARNHHPLESLIRRVDERRDTTKLVVETADGDVARLVAVNGKPLSKEANEAELDRLDNLAQHPELQEKRRKSEQKDRERMTHLLSLLPEAFLYNFEGMVPCPSGPCYRLSFAPNPKFTPPDLEANIFRGVAGEVWIDQAQERLTRLDAHFIAEVDFGFGILGRLNKGGTALLEQSDIGDNDWELTDLKIHVNGKALLVKSFSYQVNEEASHFSPVAPGLHYRDAISLLKKSGTLEATSTP